MFCFFSPFFLVPNVCGVFLLLQDWPSGGALSQTSLPSDRPSFSRAQVRCFSVSEGLVELWGHKSRHIYREDTLRTAGELVRRKTAHSSLHRRQHLQFPLEQRSEVHRNQYCEQFSAVGNRVRSLVSPTKTLNTDLAPRGGSAT